MLRTAGVNEALKHVNGDGVHTSMLLGSTGGVMGIACAMSHIPDNTRVAAVASSIWTEYYKACEASLQGRQLDMIMLDMESGRIGVANVAGEYLLACVATPSTQWGMLKMKLTDTAAAFTEQLQQLGMVEPRADAAGVAAGQETAAAAPAAADSQSPE